VLLTKCEEFDHELGGVDWRWQSADCCQTKRGVPKKGKMDAEVRRLTPTVARAGVKNLLVGAGGGPLAVCISGANVNDATVESDSGIGGGRAARAYRGAPQHLCLDKGYDNRTGEGATVEAGYVPHIRRIGEEKKDERGERPTARRWVVERTFGWLSRWRGILIRWEKKANNYKLASSWPVLCSGIAFLRF